MNLAFVPLRGGSKGIPGKNIKILNGKPLAYWCLKSLQDCIDIDKIVVATDSNNIKNVVNSFKFNKVEIYNRQQQNANDNSATESVMLEYLSFSKLESSVIFLLVQATSPFITTKDISNALKMYKSKKYDSILSCTRFKRFLWNDDGSPINYNFKERPRRQDFDGSFLENGALYISSVSNICNSKNRLSGKIGIYEMKDYSSHEIDEPGDWFIAEQIMKNLYRDENLNDVYDIKLVASDVDGVLTDSGMYYDEKSNEYKKFNTRDGMGFQLLREIGIKTALITSEKTNIVKRRANKLKIDYLYMGVSKKEKLESVIKIAEELNISLKNVAYIGDDVNCLNLLQAVGLAACPSDSHHKIKNIPSIKILESKGGSGAFREFADLIYGIKEAN